MRHLICLAIALLLSAVASAQVTFQHTSYPFTGDRLIVGDFNGDGAPDLLGIGQNAFLLLLNDGTGNFSGSLITIPTGGVVNHPIALDANKDGRSDVAGCYPTNTSSSQGNVGVWLATSGPNFSAPASYPLPGICVNVVAGDFNEDGNTDLAASYYSLNSAGTYDSGVIVFFGDGKGNFSAGPVSVLTNSCSFGTAGAVSGDFNHDGHADVLISFGCGNTGVAFANGHGDGTFTFSLFSANEDIYFLRKDDIDQDGWLDWMTRGVQPQTGANNLSFFINARNPGVPAWNVQTPITYPCLPCLGSSANFVIDGLAADVMGDGMKDAVVTERYSAPDFYGDSYFLSVLARNPDGSYAAPARFPVGPEPLQVIAADFDRDGRIDFVVTTVNDFGGTTDVFLNRTATAPTCYADPVVRSVKVCSPSQISGNSVQVLANTTDSAPVTGMKVYVDNTMTFYSPNELINRWLTIPNGGHRLTVRAWDARGSFSSARWINVNTSFGCSMPNYDRTIHICFPTGNSTVGNPVQVVAAVRDSKTYYATGVYVDGVLMYSVSGKQVNSELTLPLGTHQITLKGRDIAGTFSSTVSVSVR